MSSCCFSSYFDCSSSSSFSFCPYSSSSVSHCLHTNHSRFFFPTSSSYISFYQSSSSFFFFFLILTHVMATPFPLYLSLLFPPILFPLFLTQLLLLFLFLVFLFFLVMLLWLQLSLSPHSFFSPTFVLTDNKLSSSCVCSNRWSHIAHFW